MAEIMAGSLLHGDIGMYYSLGPAVASQVTLVKCRTVVFASALTKFNEWERDESRIRYVVFYWLNFSGLRQTLAKTLGRN